MHVYIAVHRGSSTGPGGRVDAPPVADLRFGEGGGFWVRGLWAPKARSARGLRGMPSPGNV